MCRRKTYQPFVKGIKTPIVFEQELRSQIVRIFVNNKLVKHFENVKQPGDFEQPFPYNDGELKMEFRWDDDNEEPELLLDGTHHDLLPFIAPTFVLDE